MRIIDISFFVNNSSSPVDILRHHWPAAGYAAEMKPGEVELIKFMAAPASINYNGITLTAFSGKDGFFHIPAKAIAHIAGQQPDLVIVQGLSWPLQTMYLRRKIGKQAKILVQHHGEKPFGAVKRKLQVMADGSIDGYLFTSEGNAAPWLKAGVIQKSDKIYELLEASTVFRRQPRIIAKKELQLKGDYNFLWVGRLNAGKDPITVLKAFALYVAINDKAKLYMIYGEDDLLAEVQGMISADRNLTRAVKLLGKKDHAQLEVWYSAADFFISGSHFEGSGYALIEAMACGCIPVLTNIPSFQKITNGREHGFLFPAGDDEQLLNVLNSLPGPGRETLHEKISAHFENELSFKAIAARLKNIFQQLASK